METSSFYLKLTRVSGVAVLYPSPLTTHHLRLAAALQVPALSLRALPCHLENTGPARVSHLWEQKALFRTDTHSRLLNTLTHMSDVSDDINLQLYLSFFLCMSNRLQCAR